MSEIADRYRRVAGAFTGKVAAVPANGWDAATPCDDWTARQLVAHVVEAETGAVLGVVNMVLLKNTRESALSQPSGISYAVPSKFVRALLERVAGR